MKKNILAFIVLCAILLTKIPSILCMHAKMPKMLQKGFSKYTLSTFAQKLGKQNDEKQLFLFMGPPCSGKGSVGKELENHTRCQTIGTGKWLRELQEKTCQKQMCSGQLIDDTFVADWAIENAAQAIANEKNDIVALDGFPRTIRQAYSFLDWFAHTQGLDTFTIVNFLVTKQFIEKYALNRASCPVCKKQYIPVEGSPYKPKIANQCNDCGRKLEKRSDDTKKTLVKRMAQYKKESKKIQAILEKNPGCKTICLYMCCTGWDPLDKQFDDFKSILAQNNGDI